MRLFIAIQLSEELQRTITKTMHELKKQDVKGNYVPTRNLHLTLVFIGEMKDPEPVIKAMRSVKYKPFKLTLSEMGNFGELLWVGMKGKQGLSGLVKDIRTALDRAEVPYDKKKFMPHITIVRKMNGKWQNIQAPKGEMTVKKVSLMKSEMKDGKRVYTEVFSI